MKKSHLALIVGLSALNLALGPLQNSVAANQNLNNAAVKLKKNEDNIKYYQNKIQTKNQQLNQISKSISQVEQELDFAGQKYEVAQRRYDAAHNEVLHLSQDLDKAIKSWDQKRDSLMKNVRRLYKYKYTATVKTFIEARSLPELTRRAMYYNIIQEKERNDLDEIKANQTKINRLRDKKMLQRQEYAVETRELEEAKREYQLKLAEQKSVKKRLASDKAFYERAERELEADSQRIADRLRSLYTRQQSSPTYSNVPLGTGRFINPVHGPMTSPFGYRVHPIFGSRRLHTGQDFGVPAGTPILAADSGVVIEAGWMGGYGKAVMIDHGKGIVTLYAHTSAFYVRPGQKVMKGQQIAAVGSTGNSTGPHLHLEVRQNGTPVNPLGWF